MGLTKILAAIYEADFLDCSFGFRPGRGGHDAFKVLSLLIEIREITSSMLTSKVSLRR